jgi:hypothetical protein
MTVAPGVTVGAYIAGGYQNVAGSYSIDIAGQVTQVWFKN